MEEKYPEACKFFENGVQANPNDYSLWNKLGAARVHSENYEDAIIAYERALAL